MRLALYAVMSMLLLGAVSATTTTLSDDELTMAYTDTRIVEFCLYDANGQQNIDVVVDPICKDLNSLYGCQAGQDDYTQTVFTVTPSQATMNDGDCINLTLQTNVIDPNDGGQFYYTVNGQVGGTTIGSETGTVFVPEFGVLAAIGVLVAAGLFIVKRRG